MTDLKGAVIVVAVFVVPAAVTVPFSLAVFPGPVVFVLVGASLLCVVVDVAHALDSAAQDVEVALLDFVAVFAVVHASHVPQAVPEQVPVLDLELYALWRLASGAMVGYLWPELFCFEVSASSEAVS